jgi:hypothetical protein
LLGLLVSIPVYGGVITTQTFDFSNQDGLVRATVTVTVLDNYRGDPAREDWIYTINNLSFTTTPAPNAPSIGLMAFGTAGGSFATLTFYHLSDVTGVHVPGNDPSLMGDISPGFCYQCDLFGGGWVLPDSRGLGVLPGQSATVDFSWLNVPGAVTTSVTASAYLGIINYYFGYVSSDLSGSVLVPRTTALLEPATFGLVAFALCLFGFWQWRRQHPRTRATLTL